METNEVETDLGTMVEGARGTVAIIMMMKVEIATYSTIIMAIRILEAERENLARAVVERCLAQRHGALMLP